MKRIGFLSTWGIGRGLANVTLNYAKMLKGEFEVHILKQGKNEIAKDFKTVDVNITEIPGYFADPEVFRMWIKENKLDAIVFNEYKQWNDDGNDLIAIAKEEGCKVYGYLVLERFEIYQTREYDKLFAPSLTMLRFLRSHKIRNFVHIPYSIDLKEFPETERPANEKFTFFHPGGFGGVHNRKNTWRVIEAFECLENVEDCKLIITSQKQLQFNRELHPNIEIVDKDMDREELLKYYWLADAVVLPSKWETIGIPILESLASGTPVITSDIPPMNEFIRPGLNGYLCSGELNRYEGISIHALDVDIKDLKTQMENIMNPTILPMLCRNSRHITKEIYDLEKNKKFLINFLKEDLK